jgi:hypothetical protein
VNPAKTAVTLRMIRKSGDRFSEKIMRLSHKLARDRTQNRLPLLLIARARVLFHLAYEASVVDLTFASVSPRVFHANVKSKTTLESISAGVPLVLTFVKVPA